MEITVKGIFDSIIVKNVIKVNYIPKNTRDILFADNCIVSNNDKFIFFRGYMDFDNKRSIYKIEWSRNLELDLKKII